MLGELTARGRDPDVGITVHEATITLRITAEGSSADECRDKIEKTRNAIINRMGTFAFGSEDEEPAMFSGTIPQALLMMNGPLVQTAISGDKGSYLTRVIADPSTKKPQDKVRALYLAALGRVPTSSEIKGLSAMMSRYPDAPSAFQDLYWALLNSNEFIVNH